MTSYRETQLQSFYDKAKTSTSDAYNLLVTAKDEKLADKLRSTGNKFYFDGHFINAINEYNKSLCFAPLDGDKFNLSVAYANRADALFRMELYRECMRSIELAEESEYPEHLKDRLTLMTSKCKDKLKFTVQARPKYQLKLSYPALETIPSTANCLQLKQSDAFGRYLVAQQDLSVGNVVMIERPFIVCLRPNMRYKRCAHCMAGDKRHALVPCPTCTNTMYCSAGCLKEAWHVYHRFECKLSENLNQCDEFLAIALRSLFVGVTIYGSLEEFQKYLKEHEDTQITAFDLDFKVADKKREFLVLHKMHFEDSHMSISDRNYWMKEAAKWTLLLIKAEVFPSPISVELVAFILNTLYRYTITNIVNCYETSASLPPKYEKEFVTVSQHLTMAMVNHACAPNVQRIQQGGSQVLMVVRPIAKGGQLFDNYGMIYTAHSKKERQDKLFSQYGFRCGCAACQEGFPVAKKLKYKKGLGSVTNLVDLLTQGNAGLEGKLNRADKLAEYLQKYDEFYPCVQLREADYELYEIYTGLVDEELWEHKYKEFFNAKN